jgi:hypothetical protein
VRFAREASAGLVAFGLLVVLASSVDAGSPVSSASASVSGGNPWPSGAAASTGTTYDMSASYDVAIHLRWATGQITVSTEMDVDNTSGMTVDHLELNTVAARLGHMTLLDSRVNGSMVTARVSDQTLIVPLPKPLQPYGEALVHTKYRARLLHSAANHDWLWSQVNDVASVYRSIPWLSARRPFDRPNDGDPFVTQTASRVQVTFTSDTPLVYATSGVEEQGSTGLTAAFTANLVRDFNFTASRRYTVLNGQTEDGDHRIVVMTKWMSSAQASRMLAVARHAIAQYTQWIGPIGCPTITIAEIAAGVSMESPCLVWITRGSGPFTDYRVAHEVGHQWFYGMDGNDQALDPFFDEATTDFLARTFLDQLRASQCAKNRLDLSIYQYQGTCYYETIYIQGSLFLNSIRRQLGSKAFWETLSTFWRDHRWTVTNTKALLEAFRAVGGDRLLPEYHKRFPSLYP